MRAGDADRQQVADQLRRALDEGRLSLDEYDERLGSAYAAKTYADLDQLLVDLPTPAPAPAPPPSPVASWPPARPEAPAAPVLRRNGSVRAAWTAWMSVAAINVGIWLAVSLIARKPVYFWPIWVIGPWGAVLLMSRGNRCGPRTRYRRMHPRRGWY